ncbi:MAG: hypothetical protein KC619_08180 [Myxococcales bacterium]|nr:hypothetical protein [Myxococcales bacterium]
MLRHRATLLLTLASLVSACGSDEPTAPTAPAPTPTPPIPTPPPPASVPATPPPSCVLEPTRTVASDVRARRGLALADGWVLALDETLVAVGPEARHAVSRPDLRRLLAVAVVGDGPLALFEGSTADTAHALIAIDPRTGAEVVRPLSGAIATSRRATDEDGIWLAWSGPSGTRGLERFERGASGLTVTSLALGDDAPSEEAPVEVLDLLVDGERWAATWRLGPTEDPQSRVLVSTDAGHRVSDGLHEALAIESSAFDGSALVLVASFEFARPGLVRFAPDEEPLAIVGPGQAAPPPLGERTRASLDVDDEGLWLARRDALGQRLGARTRVVDGPVEMAGLERRGDALGLVWATPEGIYERTVRCP